MNLASITFQGPRPPQVDWSGLTHVGRVRKNNEDVFLGLTFNGHEVHHLGKTGRASLATADFVFAVSDGMGGAKSGEFASRITIDRLTRMMPRASPGLSPRSPLSTRLPNSSCSTPASWLASLSKLSSTAP